MISCCFLLAFLDLASFLIMVTCSVPVDDDDDDACTPLLMMIDDDWFLMHLSLLPEAGWGLMLSLFPFASL
jgi:hypothetical protein